MFTKIEGCLKVVALSLSENQSSFLSKEGQPQYVQSVYSAATILLDLSANEECIDELCSTMKSLGIFRLVIKEKLAQLVDPRARLKTS